MKGGMEAVYDDIVQDLGLLKLAPALPARGRMYSARARARLDGEPAKPAKPTKEAPITEERYS